MDVVLTADRLLISDRHGKEFLGFATSAPPNWLSEWLFRYLFFPKMREKNPIIFYSSREIKGKNWFKREEMNELHKELLMKCVRHDLFRARRDCEGLFCGKVTP